MHLTIIPRHLFALFSLFYIFQSSFFAQSYGTVIEQNPSFILDPNWQSLTISDGAAYTFQTERSDSIPQFILKVHKINSDGFLEWSRSLEPADFNSDFWFLESIYALDGGLFIRANLNNNPVGVNTAQIKISEDGEIENSKQKSFWHYNDILDYLPDSTLVNIYRWDAGIHVATYSQDIEVLTETRIDLWTSTNDWPSDVDISDSTLTLVVEDGVVLNLDFNYELIWERSYPLAFGVVKAASDQTLMYAGVPQDSVPELNVFKTTSDGDIIWSKQLKFWDASGDTLFLGEGHFIEEDLNGNMHLFIDEATDSSSVYLVLDSFGNYHAAKQIPYSYNEFDWAGDHFYHMGLNWTGSTYETFVHRRMLSDTSDCFVDLNFEIFDNPIAGEVLIDSVLLGGLLWPYTPVNFLSNSFSPISYSFCDSIILSSESELYRNKGISVYPNPSRGQIQVQSDLEIEECQLYNLNGQLVFRTHELSLDISKLIPDIYFLKIRTRNKRIFNVKIVKI